MSVPNHSGQTRSGRVPAAAPSSIVRRSLAIAVLLIALLLAGWPSLEPVAAASGATIDAVELNLRAEPSFDAAIIATMYGGEWVPIYDGPTAEGWYYVGYGDLAGWTYGEFLALDGGGEWSGDADLSAPVTDEAGWEQPGGVGAAAGSAWVAIDNVNVRAWAAPEADVVGEIWYGQPVEIVGGEVEGFVPIAYGDGQAWIWRDYLAIDGPPGPERWADVDRSSGVVTLFEGDAPVASYWGAMGFDQSESGFYATAIGTYYVYEKYQGLSWTTYGRAWVSHWIGFDSARWNGFHSYSMDASGLVIPGGDGPTGGCVALAPAAAEHVFWFLRVGSRVVIHW